MHIDCFLPAELNFSSFPYKSFLFLLLSSPPPHLECHLFLSCPAPVTGDLVPTSEDIVCVCGGVLGHIFELSRL